ncbi:MAG: hypothetical protein KJ887_06800 [Candidatus Omnitrophica bacterium]|nr:hypothetical protein [Candidatus Omnitrophota bacterium]MBU1048232.1 hypothetical protein [Candidatus Omnitrophota bacterium]MBU1630984.1 hypothetical protein [Candidatus Omnitrophota bacterium]MBU1889748.1 hypothetical protein [Candidatus Omnitrophota bacterium]
MKYLFSLIAFSILVSGCIRENNSPKTLVTKSAIEDFEGHKIKIEGIYLEYAEPVLEVTSHTVGNTRNIVLLKFNGSTMMEKIGKDKIWFGDRVLVVGVVKAQNKKIPEIHS